MCVQISRFLEGTLSINATEAQALSNIPLVENLIEQKNASIELPLESTSLIKEAEVSLDYATPVINIATQALNELGTNPYILISTSISQD
ncbi:MAG: hypothetical protein MTP17_03370 [Candidatus Midichloria sp.]|nr:MAG: hypothetical protein MTP17_03370 [Candidatus Midichloria sp.]